MGIIRQRRKDETRTLLVEAGLQVFAERGAELASLDEVATSAGFTQGAIYRQLPSHGAVLLALLQQYHDVARARSREPPAHWYILLTNTGTYVDAPWHRFERGNHVAGHGLEAVADLQGVLGTATVRGRAMEAGELAGIDARGKAVLVRTGWDGHWRTEQYGKGLPF